MFGIFRRRAVAIVAMATLEPAATAWGFTALEWSRLTDYQRAQYRLHIANSPFFRR